ncbi:MAG: cupredoxin family copper-binding protein [Chloroflexi bacterium]|nr:cupredoxin family copper-binding protein [Chloroflexota bacterium]MCH8201151.1 cupredoxin family copper-binding protein [Chloroflexota bacterium]MCI0783418.1 cupredoxin family copper-binding protein [Chloroflexota bacterium]MCI0814995.1 cupredoxin family copper-binding protein [Chloroflexota bacterium]MCI0817038.1 cupredoxin family copper-binding protein [Chloroflexota bacterium]
MTSDAPKPRANTLALAVFAGAITVLAVAVLVGLALSSGSGNDEDATPTVLDDLAVTIEIIGFQYRPPNLSVPVGATVTWLNLDVAAHDSAARDGMWETVLLQRDEEFAVTFDEPGTWDYYCTIHPYMTATLTVR